MTTQELEKAVVLFMLTYGTPPNIEADLKIRYDNELVRLVRASSILDLYGPAKIRIRTKEACRLLKQLSDQVVALRFELSEVLEGAGR